MYKSQRKRDLSRAGLQSLKSVIKKVIASIYNLSPLDVKFYSTLAGCTITAFLMLYGLRLAILLGAA